MLDTGRTSVVHRAHIGGNRGGAVGLNECCSWRGGTLLLENTVAVGRVEVRECCPCVRDKLKGREEEYVAVNQTMYEREMWYCIVVVWYRLKVGVTG